MYRRFRIAEAKRRGDLDEALRLRNYNPKTEELTAFARMIGLRAQNDGNEYYLR